MPPKGGFMEKEMAGKTSTKTSTGNCSTGDYSTGDCSTGDYSTGYRSTGDYSTGYRSTGYCSTGDYSTGYRSAGDYSTGNFSTGNFSVGHFSTKDYAPHGWFNQPSEVRWSEVELPSFLNFRLTEWVGSDKLSEQERADNQSHETTGGYVKIYTYHEAWANYWATLSEDEKKMFEALPHFDADIFEEITGIDVRIDKQVPEAVVVDGVRYVREADD